MSIAYSITPNSINVLLDGRMRTINSTHTNFNAVSAWLKKYAANPVKGQLDKLRDLLDIRAFIAKITEGRVKIGDTIVTFDGKEMKGVMVERMLGMLRDGFDVRPLARFMEKVLSNPTLTAQDEIFLFMESGNLPLTADGDFLAFKKVNPDFKSIYDGRTDHSIGSKPYEPRETCDTSRSNTCSRGLHFCSFPYLSQYQGTEGHVVIVKVNPADVVAIPYDYQNTKGRAWTYEVIGEVPEDECKDVWNSTHVVNSWGTYEGENEESGDTDESDYESGHDEYEGEEEEEIGDDGVIEVGPQEEPPLSDAEVIAALAGTDFSRLSLSPEHVKAVLLGAHDELVRAFSWNATPMHLSSTWRNINEGSVKLAGTYRTYVRALRRYAENGNRLPVNRTIGEGAFQHDGRMFTKCELVSLVKEHGQRGTSRLTGIPRSTLQGWLAE